MHPIKFSFLFLLVFIISCREASHHDPELQEVLQMAGKNRIELERVLTHYSDKRDSLKYKAAVFLIKNMPGKYGISFANYESYQAIFDTIPGLNLEYERRARNIDLYKYYKQSVIETILPTIQRNANTERRILRDLDVITASFLIENIDYAFKAWDNPWARKLPFDEFCEYILPYRYGKEELTHWRKRYYEQEIESLRALVGDEPDPVKVCNRINQKYSTTFSELEELRLFNNAIRPLDLLRINTSTSCLDQSGLGLIRMRSLGVPVVRLNIPLWGNRGSGHDLNAVRSLDKKWICFQNGEAGPGQYQFLSIFTIPKIFAETYARNPGATYVVQQPDGNILINPWFVDVTKEIVKTTGIAPPLESQAHKNGAQLALCVFNNKDWIPIVTATRENGKTVFNDVGLNVVYITGIVSGKDVKYIGKPFLVDSLGKQQIIEPIQEKERIFVDRKYPASPWIGDKLSTMEGAEFQGSNDSLFRTYEHLWKIDTLQTITERKHEFTKAYSFKYVRLVFPPIIERNEGLADITIYDGNDKTLEGTPYSSTLASEKFYNNVFDHSPLNYVLILNEKYSDYPYYNQSHLLVIPDQKRFWTGLAFHDVRPIKAVAITPRTDDNSINIGEEYELFTWSDGWKSLGKKRATQNHLEFDAPRQALLLLKNVHKGNEHRLFTYTSGHQLWF